jgi:hypothetical protein
MELNTDDSNFEYLGYYSPPDAAKLFTAFEAANIDFRVECFDGTSAIGSIAASHGGGFGQAAQVLIRIDAEQRENVNRIHSKLFGDCLPNYDSAFFREQRNLDPDDQAPNNKA